MLLAVSSGYSDTGRVPTRREIAEEVGCTPRTVTTHVATLREAGLLPASRGGNAISIERSPSP
ncbi:helix-turn-helix domain-containing protein [Dermabacter sp.]|uniref:helix-turn-helix domain-containing protein n=1 Tax=Dermabacter sp. TaxID=37640 RepID=UPI0039676CCC